MRTNISICHTDLQQGNTNPFKVSPLQILKHKSNYFYISNCVADYILMNLYYPDEDLSYRSKYWF